MFYDVCVKQLLVKHFLEISWEVNVWNYGQTLEK